MVDCCVICGDIIPEGSHVCPACAKTLGYDIIHKEPQRRNSIMKVNWKVRFQNKVWLSSFFACILTFVYTMLGIPEELFTPILKMRYRFTIDKQVRLLYNYFILF